MLFVDMPFVLQGFSFGIVTGVVWRLFLSALGGR